MPDYDALVDSDPVYKVLQASAYRELVLRVQVIEGARGVCVGCAMGARRGAGGEPWGGGGG
ncbi:baseplate assembly protein, partial [Stenotrophomonas maltophilia]